MKSKTTLITRLFIFLIVIVLCFGGVWVWWQDGVSAVDYNNTEPVIFVVKKGEGVKSIAAHLSSQKLIRSSTAFYVLVKYLGIERDLQAGDFRLSQSMNAITIAKELTHGIVDVWVTTLEGWRVEEIAMKLSKELDVPEAEFLKYAKEGYMFPDTYLIPRDASASAIAQLFIDNFEKKLTEKMRLDAKQTGLTIDQVIILASIVEREGKSDSDRPVIAGILNNRLKDEWPLQVDATLQYALGYQPGEKNWWKSSLTTDDKKVQSLFNTYEHVGLPPHPIANPGMSSVRAVIYPEKTTYMYYLHDKNGVAHYAVSLEEHNANIAQYLSY